MRYRTVPSQKPSGLASSMRPCTWRPFFTCSCKVRRHFRPWVLRHQISRKWPDRPKEMLQQTNGSASPSKESMLGWMTAGTPYRRTPLGGTMKSLKETLWFILLKPKLDQLPMASTRSTCKRTECGLRQFLGCLSTRAKTTPLRREFVNRSPGARSSILKTSPFERFLDSFLLPSPGIGQ